MMSKRSQRDMLIDFAASYTVHPADINPYLESIGSSPLRQGIRLRDLITRPELNVYMLADVLAPLRDKIESVDECRRDEIVEAAEILIKYQGYIDGSASETRQNPTRDCGPGLAHPRYLTGRYQYPFVDARTMIVSRGTDINKYNTLF